MLQNWQNVSVTLKYRDQIHVGRNTSKITLRLISLKKDHNNMDLLQTEHHEILAEIATRQICLVTYLYSFAFKSVFKQLFYLQLLITVSQSVYHRHRAYVHNNSDMEPRTSRLYTKHRIELLHNAPIWLELWSLTLPKLGYTVTCSECRWRNLKRTE